MGKHGACFGCATILRIVVRAVEMNLAVCLYSEWALLRSTPHAHTMQSGLAL